MSAEMIPNETPAWEYETQIFDGSWHSVVTREHPDILGNTYRNLQPLFTDRATRPAEPAAPVAEVKAWLLGDPATGQWIEVDGHRVEYSRGVGTPIVALAEAFKAQRERAYASERERNIAHSERDNAVKALETVEDILIRFIAAIDDVWSDAAEDVDLPLLRKLADVGRAQFAAHSASSPAPPRNSSQGGQHG